MRSEGADFGVAFAYDFDRYLLFNGLGDFVQGEYMIGLLAEAYFAKEPSAKIVYDLRVMYAQLTMLPIERESLPKPSETAPTPFMTPCASQSNKCSRD